MKKIILFAAIIGSVFSSCSRKETKCNSTDVRVFETSIDLENHFSNIEKGKNNYPAHSGEYYTSVDSVQMYSMGDFKAIDDSLKNYNLMVYVSAWIREAQMPIDGGIAISLNAPSGVKGWKVLFNKEANDSTWIEVKDSVLYTSDLLQEKGTEVKVFGYKEKGSDKFDSDDLKVTYKFFK